MIIIYGLFDPRLPNEIRYVGKTKMKLTKRIQYHVEESRRKLKGTYKIHWINKLLNENIRPKGIILEECNEDNWQEREKFWIAKLNNLTNSTKGGETIGYTTTEVSQYSLNGVFIKKFESIVKACEELNISRGVINSALQRNSEGGKGNKFLWRHGKHPFKNLITPYIDSKQVYIKVLDIKEDKEYIFSSIKEALNTLNLKRVGQIDNCIENKLWYKERYFFIKIN